MSANRFLRNTGKRRKEAGQVMLLVLLALGLFLVGGIAIAVDNEVNPQPCKGGDRTGSKDQPYSRTEHSSQDGLQPARNPENLGR